MGWDEISVAAKRMSGGYGQWNLRVFLNLNRALVEQKDRC
jgi:hypothetical protein